eukprot:Nitzschia sp. Nitz4//scaffold50_size126154//99087//100076//NITZ4_003698-RA/size126154-processed-gene-0.156-mRNA-1//1//CDS//3329553737//5599//frame0
MPLLAVLVYFLYLAWERPSLQIYNLPEDYTDDQLVNALEESGAAIGLMDMLFIAKRRHLIGRYLTEGETSLGDVIYDKSSRKCGGFHDYGYALYAHPHQRKLVRKRVRIYQQYTRERVTILRLPNRPLSGQPKVDLEIDLNAAAKDRDHSSKQTMVYSLFWVVFTLLSASFVLFQMNQIEDREDDSSKGLKVFVIAVGLNVPFAFAFNWTRFLMYRNWMINRGALVEDDVNARKIHNCINSAQSQDGSDVIPYSILNEEEMSYQGSIPSHSQSLAAGSQKAVDYVPPKEDTTDPNIQLGGHPNGPKWVTM